MQVEENILNTILDKLEKIESKINSFGERMCEEVNVIVDERVGEAINQFYKPEVEEYTNRIMQGEDPIKVIDEWNLKQRMKRKKEKK